MVDLDLPPPEGSKEAQAAKNGKPHSTRANYNSLEIADQVYQVQEWLSEGYRPNEIRRICAERWGLKSRTAESRMLDARRRIIADVNLLDRPQKVGQMVEQLERILKDAMKTKQLSNAIGSLRLQADLLQLLTRQN